MNNNPDNVFLCNRTHKRGGCAIFINSAFKSETVFLLCELNNTEVACCKISLGSDKMVVCCIYILPNPSVLCISELHDVLPFICSKYFNVIIVGDFNVSELANHLLLKKANISANLNCILDIINLQSLKQLISTPTRNDHILD